MPPQQREINRFQLFLAGQGLKLTTERAALVREIFSAHYHFEADELLFKMKEKRLKISRALFAVYLRTNVRTLENWEQGRARPNAQAALLINLVERYPDTIERLAAI